MESGIVIKSTGSWYTVRQDQGKIQDRGYSYDEPFGGGRCCGIGGNS